MKKIITAIVLCSLMGCATLKQDFFVSLGKDAVAELLNVDYDSLEKDSVNITSVQTRNQVRLVLGSKLQTKLTPQGTVFFENLAVRTRLTWVVLEDSARVKLNFERVKK